MKEVEKTLHCGLDLLPNDHYYFRHWIAHHEPKYLWWTMYCEDCLAVVADGDDLKMMSY